MKKTKFEIMISFSIDKERGQVNAEGCQDRLMPKQKLKNNQPLVLVLKSIEQSPTFASRLKRNFYVAQFSGELTSVLSITPEADKKEK